MNAPLRTPLKFDGLALVQAMAHNQTNDRRVRFLCVAYWTMQVSSKQERPLRSLSFNPRKQDGLQARSRVFVPLSLLAQQLICMGR